MLGIQYMVLEVGVVPLGKDIYDFSGRDKLGKIGEAVCQEYLKTWSCVKNIENVRNNKDYQKKDIDIVMTLKDEQVVTVEVKTDSYISGNMFYETISDDVKNEVGCFEKTEADFIFYYFINPQYRKAYVFNTEYLRDWVHKHKDEFTLKRVFNYSYCSWGYAFPLDRLEKDLEDSLTIVDLSCVEDIEEFEEEARKFWDKSKKEKSKNKKV